MSDVADMQLAMPGAARMAARRQIAGPHRLGDRLQGHRAARQPKGRPRTPCREARHGHADGHRHRQHRRAGHRLGPERAGPGAPRRRYGNLDRRARPRRRALARQDRPSDHLRPRRHHLSLARRSRTRCLQGRARRRLLRRAEPLGARRLHPPGQHHPGDGPRRRAARQAPRHPRHHRHRQVVHHGAHPALDSGAQSGGAYRAARSAQRVRHCLQRLGRGHQPAQHAAPVLAPQLRGGGRGADRRPVAARPRSRSCRSSSPSPRRATAPAALARTSRCAAHCPSRRASPSTRRFPTASPT